ncbi:hypothetical protein MMC30_003292 [Trapelia coarctata]|nr:hypothetical protein [Trapelia coarctata]
MVPYLKTNRLSLLLAILLAILTLASAISTATPETSNPQTPITPSTTPAPTVAERQATVPFQPAICIAGPACTMTAGVPMNPAAVKSEAGRRVENILFGAWTGFCYGALVAVLWIFAQKIGA